MFHRIPCWFIVAPAVIGSFVASGWAQETSHKTASKKPWKDLAVVLTDASFEKEVLKSPQLVLVDFWAPWAGPSRALRPILEEVANHYQGRLKFGSVNVDEVPRVCQKYKVEAIPVLIVFRSGKELERLVGPGTRERIEELLNKHLAEK